MIQGRSFKEIVGIRYSYIANKGTEKKGYSQFSQKAERLPNSTLIKAYPIFEKTLAKNVSYDAVVFDTYDYLDQVISFSLANSFVAAFKVYKDNTSDQRANKMIDLLRFGTNSSTHILLMRYGFAPENIAEISEYILSIDENTITFKPEITDAPEYLKKMVDWYLP